MKKSLGQHFLVDPNVANKIVSCLGFDQGDYVVEIGPGDGALTRILADRDIYITVLEKDEDLAKRIKFNWPGINVVSIDALQVDWNRFDRFARTGLRIIGNLPYNIASVLLWEIVSQVQAAKMVFTIQKDVALRIAAKPGNRSYGALSAWIQNFARVKYEFEISENVFYPRPNVKSAVISLESHKLTDRPKNNSYLAGILHMCFQKRRKQMKKILKGYWDEDLEQKFRELSINPQSRPEVLSPRDFERLGNVLQVSDNTN